MMINDEYDYFYADCGGFELLKFCYNGYKDDGHPGPDQWESPTGAGEVKHLYGDNADHMVQMQDVWLQPSTPTCCAWLMFT